MTLVLCWVLDSSLWGLWGKARRPMRQPPTVQSDLRRHLLAAQGWLSVGLICYRSIWPMIQAIPGPTMEREKEGSHRMRMRRSRFVTNRIFLLTGTDHVLQPHPHRRSSGGRWPHDRSKAPQERVCGRLYARGRRLLVVVVR